MKIGLTYDLRKELELQENDSEDSVANIEEDNTVEAVVDALKSNGHEVVKIGNLSGLLSIAEDLEVDIVFNLCEGQYGLSKENHVPVILEMNNIPYVGSDAITLGITLDKIFAKKCFIADDIPTPRYLEAKNVDDVNNINDLNFPLLVKPRNEGSSKSLSANARVEDVNKLKQQIELINNMYSQPALIEEFISGYEMTVAVLGNDHPIAMPVVQISIRGDVFLGHKFYTFSRLSSDDLQYICPAKISDKEMLLIQDLAIKAYKSVCCRDFGRVDFRIDEKGNPFVLEVNPLPSLSSDDIFNLFPRVVNSTYNATINKIVDYALKRYELI